MSTPRKLLLEDAENYVAFRLEMLRNAPWAFGSSPEDDRFRDVATLYAALANGDTTITAAFDADNRRILSSAGVVRETRLKRSHIATIWGVYTTPDARGRGLARTVVSAAILTAKQWTPPVGSIQLTVSENAPEAQRLYHSLGFEQWGYERDALRTGGKSYAEMYMRLATGH